MTWIVKRDYGYQYLGVPDLDWEGRGGIGPWVQTNRQAYRFGTHAEAFRLASEYLDGNARVVRLKGTAECIAAWVESPDGGKILAPNLTANAIADAIRRGDWKR